MNAPHHALRVTVKIENHDILRIFQPIVQIRLKNSHSPSMLRQPRHQGGAHGGRAPAKIVRAPAKVMD